MKFFCTHSRGCDLLIVSGYFNITSVEYQNVWVQRIPESARLRLNIPDLII